MTLAPGAQSITFGSKGIKIQVPKAKIIDIYPRDWKKTQTKEMAFSFKGKVIENRSTAQDGRDRAI